MGKKRKRKVIKQNSVVLNNNNWLNEESIKKLTLMKK